MHIPDGLLPPSISIIGYGVTGGVTWYCLRQIKQEKNSQAKIPKASLLTAAFFVISLIHIPVPPTSIHLILNGLIGIILGYYSFLAILIGLFFQAVMFHHGGLSTLGINAIIMGIPALLAYHLFQLREHISIKLTISTPIFAFLSGSGSLAISALIYTIVTITNISSDFNVEQEKIAIVAALIGYSIQAVIEGIVTMLLISFLEQVKPEILEN